MAERRLKRQLNLAQVLMLGTSGTIAAEVFVLTGHVAGMSGPASVLVLLLVGLLSVSFALNYAELATAYPVTGGALTYVQEAYGTGLRSFLVGSLDSLSSAFYAALSAVGFAFSLRIFLPFVPIVPTALVVVLAFMVLNLLGVGNVGRVQLVLGMVLLGLLGAYVAGALGAPRGFRWERFLPDGRFFIHDGLGANVAMMFSTMALIFNAFVGFELIADDAEEVANPSRNIPIALLASVLIITVIYVAVTMATLGTVPWTEVAGSETSLTEASARIWPTVGPALIGVAGIIATLTSLNTAMLSATREALTLSRLGLWPSAMSRLGRMRVPYVAILGIGVVVALMSIVGLVDLLSYISSSGYLFVMFWSGLAMIRLRRDRPDLVRPFRVPLFPLSAYVQIGTCVVVVAFTAPTALLFGAGVIGALTAAYYLRPPVAAVVARRAAAVEVARDRLLVAVANPETAGGLVRLAASLSEQRTGSPVEVLAVSRAEHKSLPPAVDRLTSAHARRQGALLRRVSRELQGRNVPYFTELRMAACVTEGILGEIARRGDVRLLLMGWPGRLQPGQLAEHPVARLLAEAPVDVATFLNRGMPARPRRVLVPFGGGIHSRLALRLAVQLVEPHGGVVVALRCYHGAPGDNGGAPRVLGEDAVVDLAFEETPDVDDELHDELMLAREAIHAEFGSTPEAVCCRVIESHSVLQGILSALGEREFDLVAMGAALAPTVGEELFGSLTDAIAEALPTSVLLVRRYEPAPITWLRRRVKGIVEPVPTRDGEVAVVARSEAP